jgi:DNA-binding NarL/FixJ family response regulator
MPSNQKSTSIMVVDDHSVVRHGLRSLFAGHPDFTIVAEAESGAQVIPLLSAHPTDVILLDIQLKGQSGIDVARRVRKTHPEVKIIILTTYDDESLLQAALEAGVHGYLLKSTSHEKLPDYIRAVMGGEKLLSPSLVSTLVTSYGELAREDARRQAGLKADELAVLAAIAEGASNKEISERFYWSEATVKRKVQDILDKLHADTRAHAVAEAIRRGWI